MDFIDKINELKNIVTNDRKSIECDYIITDTTYKRFLVGSKGDVVAASKKMIEFLKWRVVEKPESLTLDDNGILLEQQKEFSYIYKTDKFDRPVIYIETKKYDKNNRNINDIKKYVIWQIESVLKQTNPDEEKIVVLFDLSEFSLIKTMDYEVVKLFVNILQNNYDEILGLGIIINSPWIFAACWKIIRPWLDPTTAAKIVFSNPHEVTDVIPIENQPDFLQKQQNNEKMIPSVH